MSAKILTFFYCFLLTVGNLENIGKLLLSTAQVCQKRRMLREEADQVVEQLSQVTENADEVEMKRLLKTLKVLIQDNEALFQEFGDDKELQRTLDSRQAKLAVLKKDDSSSDTQSEDDNSEKD